MGLKSTCSVQNYREVNTLSYYKYQLGSPTNFLTDSYLALYFTLADMNKGKHTGMILIDFQKVFSTLDYKILNEKMTLELQNISN